MIFNYCFLSHLYANITKTLKNVRNADITKKYVHMNFDLTPFDLGHRTLVVWVFLQLDEALIEKSWWKIFSLNTRNFKTCSRLLVSSRWRRPGRPPGLPVPKTGLGCMWIKVRDTNIHTCYEWIRILWVRDSEFREILRRSTCSR